MGSHRRSNIYIPADPIRKAPRGKHRAPEAEKDKGLRTATIVAATGAIVAGAAQLGAGTASAEPIAPPPAPALPFEIPAGLIPAGFQLPVVPPTPELQALGLPDIGAAAQQWVDSLEIPNPLDGLQALKNRTVQPVSGQLTSNFGSRWGAHHGGIDIAAPIGTPIYAAADGTVSAAGPASGFGLWVKVLHADGTETIYGHVNDYSVSEGQQVSAGQEIATVGNRGESSGPHLHFEVHDPSGAKVDPAQWLATRGVSVTWDGNGRNA